MCNIFVICTVKICHKNDKSVRFFAEILQMKYFCNFSTSFCHLYDKICHNLTIFCRNITKNIHNFEVVIIPQKMTKFMKKIFVGSSVVVCVVNEALALAFSATRPIAIPPSTSPAVCWPVCI
jgi:hypothetical protein